MSRRGTYLIWFRGRHIPPSMPYREARSVAESSEGPTASKSDRTGRNHGMTRLVLLFSLELKHSVSAWVYVSTSSLPKKSRCSFLQETEISVDSTGINVVT